MLTLWFGMWFHWLAPKPHLNWCKLFYTEQPKDRLGILEFCGKSIDQVHFLNCFFVPCGHGCEVKTVSYIISYQNASDLTRKICHSGCFDWLTAFCPRKSACIICRLSVHLKSVWVAKCCLGFFVADHSNGVGWLATQCNQLIIRFLARSSLVHLEKKKKPKPKRRSFRAFFLSLSLFLFVEIFFKSLWPSAKWVHELSKKKNLLSLSLFQRKNVFLFSSPFVLAFSFFPIFSPCALFLFLETSLANRLSWSFFVVATPQCAIHPSIAGTRNMHAQAQGQMDRQTRCFMIQVQKTFKKVYTRFFGFFFRKWSKK